MNNLISVLGLCCIRIRFRVGSGINHSALVTRGQSSIEEVMIGNLEALVLLCGFVYLSKFEFVPLLFPMLEQKKLVAEKCFRASFS